MTRTTTHSTIVTTGAAGAAVLLACGLGVVGLGPLGAARAETVKTITYTCTMPLLGAQQVPVTFHLTAPPTMSTAQPFTLGLSTDIAVSSQVAQLLPMTGATSADFTATVHTTWTGSVTGTADGQTTVTGAKPPASGAWTISGPSTYPAMTATVTGPATVTANDIFTQLTPRTAAGEKTFLGTADVPCTVTAGQDAVLTTVEVE